MGSPILLFPGFSERDIAEAEMKGYSGHVVVHLPTGPQYTVTFYDPVTLVQNLKVAQESGEVCIGEPGLIVVPSVTLHYMEAAVNQLSQEGYFGHLIPLQHGAE